MKALCWHGKRDVRVERVPDPKIINPSDAIIRVTSTAICGSDLHLYNGFIPTLKEGDILGHEFMGEVVDIGRNVKKLAVGDRVVVPFNISCGACWYCQHQEFSLCDNSNPNAVLNANLNGFTTAGLFGYSHLYGGYAGGQAEFVRVPFADVGPIKVPGELSDDQALFLSDIFPTGYQAAESCNIQPGHIVAIWGCGPVGQFAIRSAFLLGAHKVVAIDNIPERMVMAEQAGAVTISSSENVHEALKEITGGRGPDSCIDAVGMEAHGSVYDSVKHTMRLENDRPVVLRQAMRICRKGGTVSIPGVYSGFIDKIPFGVAFAKGLTLRMGQTHVQKYMRPLLDRIQRGEIDPSFVITHRLPLANADEAYATFARKEQGCIKVVLKPDAPPTLKPELETPTRAPLDHETFATPRSKRLQPR
ncbi:MAG TPA: zinc-dependent alcohol dehydrogenase [Verrucomicrobiae bacterium]|nr:zinc-dependent alcohol dehydrogenase [Verrucomicrobiae bacterium]